MEAVFGDTQFANKEVEAIAAAVKDEVLRNERRSNFFMRFILLKERYVIFLYQKTDVFWVLRISLKILLPCAYKIKPFD